MDVAQWDARYEAFTNTVAVEPDPWVRAQVVDLPPGRALDLGAGDGRQTLGLAAQGWAVTAVDFSSAALGRLTDFADALESSAGRITTVQADLMTYTPDVSTFDLVVIAFMHPPVDDRRRMITGAANALAPGGVLLLIGHDKQSAGRGVGGPDDVELLWTTEALLADIAHTSLSLVSAAQVHRTVHTPDGPNEALDTAVVARRPIQHKET
jgi:SAM-dependent methyltransferase